jgi:hypothetical protein
LAVSLSVALVGFGCDDDGEQEEADIDGALVEGDLVGDLLATRASAELVGVDRTIATAKIASMIQTLNDGEIMQATAVLPLTEEEPAEDFANRMIDEHQVANAELDEALFQLQIIPLDNSVSVTLRDEVEGSIGTIPLTTSEGAARSYLLMQVQMHEAALILINSVLDLGLVTDLDPLLLGLTGEILDHRDDAADQYRDL